LVLKYEKSKFNTHINKEQFGIINTQNRHINYTTDFS